MLKIKKVWLLQTSSSFYRASRESTIEFILGRCISGYTAPMVEKIREW
jgi:hypothetical protein